MEVIYAIFSNESGCSCTILTLSFWALSCVRFETFTNVEKAWSGASAAVAAVSGSGISRSAVFACYFRIQRTVEALFIDRKGPTADT